MILGGHDHIPMVESEGRTLIIKAGADAINVGQVQYELGCGADIPGRRHRLIPVDAGVAEAPDVAAFVAGYHAQANPRLDRPVTQLRAPLDTRETLVRREAAPVGRFIAEVMRRRMGAEVALINAGAIRSNRVIPAGPLSLRDVVALLPFGNTVALLEVDGAALQVSLEHSVEALPRPAGRFLQTAGLDYVLDASRPLAAASCPCRWKVIRWILPAATAWLCRTSWLAEATGTPPWPRARHWYQARKGRGSWRSSPMLSSEARA